MPTHTEADTCRKYILPKLYATGWTDDQISEQRTFTDGCIIATGDRPRRRPQKRADYILRYRREFDIAGAAMPMQKIETIDQPRSEAVASGQLSIFEKQTKRKEA